MDTSMSPSLTPSSSGGGPRRIGVIGGGAVGVSAASWLLRDGHDVVLIEPTGFGEGASFGNAGCLNSSSIVPMSMPGTFRKVPGYLIDPLGPLVIRWRYLPQVTPWLARFVMASKPERVRHQARALRALLEDAPGMYAPLVKNAGAQALLRQNGHLIVYRTKQDFDKDQFAWRLRRDNDIEFSVLNKEELRQLEPNLSRDYTVAVFFPNNAYTVSPYRLISALGESFVHDGGTLLKAKAIGFAFEGDVLRGIRTEDGVVAVDGAVVAAGAQSKHFATELGDKVMLDTERGYHIVIKTPEVTTSRSIMDVGGKFVATPMEEGLRLAGTVELAGLEALPDWRRSRILLTLGRRLLPGLLEIYPDDRLSLWMGFRPSMPDSLPVIGPSRRSNDVIYAFGHGHIGLASAARTGRVVADLLSGRQSHIDISPFSAKRF